MNAETTRQLLELVRLKGTPLILDPSLSQPNIQTGYRLLSIYSYKHYDKKQTTTKTVYQVLDVTNKRDWNYSLEQYRDGKSLSFELFLVKTGCLDSAIVRQGKRLRPTLMCRYQIPLFNRYLAAIVSDQLAVNVSEPDAYNRHYMNYAVVPAKAEYVKFELYELNLLQLLQAAPKKEKRAVA
jgi:hypothetical protein